MARSPAYRRRVGQALREAGLPVGPLNAIADLRDVPAEVEPVVVVAAIDFAHEPAPSPATAGREVVAIALIDDATADVKAEAQAAGWDIVLDRDAPLGSIVAEARTAMRQDDESLAADAADATVTDAAALAEDAPRLAIELKVFQAAAAGAGLGETQSALSRVRRTLAWQQFFDNAWVVWHPRFGAAVLRRDGAVAARYAQLGGPAGELGAPVTDETTVDAGSYCRFELPGSAIAWHPHLGVHELRGAIGSYWLETGGPAGPWGFPTSNEHVRHNGDLAVDFEGGTLVWRADGTPAQPMPAVDASAGAWATLLDEPPRRARAHARSTHGHRVHSPYGAAGVVHAEASGAAVAATVQIEHSRSLIDVIEHPPKLRRTERFATTVTAEEVLRTTGATLPAGVSATDLYQAAVTLWRDLWSSDKGPTGLNIFPRATLTCAGLSADGDLERLIWLLVTRAPVAQRLLFRVGLSVEAIGTRYELVAADVAHGWRLSGPDAARYIAADPRLASMLTGVLTGNVSRALLDDAGEPLETNDHLRQAGIDAQFLWVISGPGRLPGWSLLPPWTPKLRAAVAHNIAAGCLTGWDVYEQTAGNPAEVIRAMAWDFFCGPGALLVQSPERFSGALGHGALERAARTFPAVTEDDDGHGIYISAGGLRRRVDKPQRGPLAMGGAGAAPSPAAPHSP